jgi:hypothetical protein
MLKTIFLSTLLVAFAFAGEAETKLPASAQQVLDKAEAAVAANRAAYDKANQKPLADAEKALRQELDKATKAGKLNDALAIQKALEGLRESVVASVDEAAKSGKGDLLGDTKVDTKVVVIGKWLAGPVALTINKDNTWTSPWADFGGSWRIIKGQLELTSNKGNNQILTFDPKEGAKWIWNGGKSGGVSSRVAE